MDILIQYLVNGFMLGSVYALIAIGYTLVFGVLNMLNMAHGDILMMAGFFSLLSVPFMPGWAALLVGIAGAGLLGVILDLIGFEPVDKKYPMAPVISSVAFGMVLANVAANISHADALPFPQLIQLGDFYIRELQISSMQLLMFVISVVLTLALTFFIKKTKQGMAIRAIAENHITAQLLGVNVRNVTMAVFFLSAALGGVAGLLIALRFATVTPWGGMHYAIKGLIVMVLGGLGNIQGALIAGLILGMLEAMAVAYISGEAAQLLSLAVLVLTLLIRPTGLLGVGLGGRSSGK